MNEIRESIFPAVHPRNPAGFLIPAVIVGLLAASAVSTYAQDPTDTLEEGIRLRLYYVGEEMTTLQPLLPAQSPNIDTVIPRFKLDGHEDYFTDTRGMTYTSNYLLELAALLRVEQAGPYEFKIESGNELEMDIGDRRFRSDGRSGSHFLSATLELAEGDHPVVLRTFAAGQPAVLNVAWRRQEGEVFQPVPEGRLWTEFFYFRPTDGGRKQLSAPGFRPGHGMKVEGSHPAFEVTTVRPHSVELPVGGLDFLRDGRLVVAEFDARQLVAPDPTPEPNGALWILDNVDSGDRSLVTRELVADGLYEPVGVCVVGDDIYVSHRTAVTRFRWLPASGTYVPEVVATGWETNDFHQLSFGLIHEPGREGHPGYLYMARSPGLGNMRNPPNHGSVWKIDLAREPGDNIEYLTGGHRTPNGIAWGPDGEIFVSDNQGEWTPANELNHVQRGHFYGYYHPTDHPDAHPAPFQNEAGRLSPGQGITRAAVKLPQDEIANSPSQPIMIPEGSPFAGQMLMGDMRYGGIQRLVLENVDGIWQGAVFRFTQGLEAGVNRLAWGADGSLYAGGIGGNHASTWNWVNPDGESTYQGLQRLIPTGRTAFEMETIRAVSDGFEIRFTHPVPRSFLQDAGNFEAWQWTYEATPAYGGSKQEYESLDVTHAQPSDDGTMVRLTIPGLLEGRVVHIVTDPVSEDGEGIWSTEAWYTLNRIPSD